MSARSRARSRRCCAARGLYSSHLTGMAARSSREGSLKALAKPRGPKGRGRDPVTRRERAAAQRERPAAATARAGEDDPRYPKKSLRAPGDPPEPAVERRRRMRAAVETLAPTVGVAPACRALGVARASVYRHREIAPVPKARSSRRPLPCALAPQERHAGVGHAPRRSLRGPSTCGGVRHLAGRRGGICVRSARCIGCCMTPTR